MPEEAFTNACPVCRNICNCIDCLRLNGKHLMNVELKFNDEEKLEYAKHILHALLPALEQFNTEQLIEKLFENQIRGSEVNIDKEEHEKNEGIYCNYCRAYIVDFYRGCSTCSYKLCLTCCQELRNGNLQAAASEVRMQYIDNGPAYLHGKGYSITSAEKGICAGTSEVKIRNQTKMAMASKWKLNENGTTPCPSKDTGGCSNGTLNLRCIFSEDWISQLTMKAKEIARKCILKEMHNDSELHYSCSMSKGENGTSGGKLRKAAARENSDDNYVFCPAAVDTRCANLRHFQLSLAKGEPLVVTNVHDTALGLSWEPMVMWRAFRQIKKDTDVLNCLNWCKLEMNIHQFFKGYMERCSDSCGWPKLLRLNDWPPSGQFDERLPRHGAEFFSCLPFMQYTHPDYGYLNLAQRLPDNCTKPDLGPKAYIGYGFPKELGRGDSVTKLHYAVTDTVNVLMQTQAVVPTVEQLAVIENLKQMHKAHDQRERMHESIKDYSPNVNGKSVLKGLNFSQEKQQNYDGLKVENSSKSENKKYSQQSVKADCESNKDGEEYQYREDSSSLIGQDRSEGFEEADGGALWDVFRRQDVPKLEEYLRKHFREFRHIHGSPLPQAFHPILDETFYLSTEHKRRLKEEYGIEPWTFVQKLGDAVFVPAGCPYQVRNLKSCINIAVDFISPENVNESIRLTEELRKLPRNHDAKEDKLGVKNIIVHAMSQAVNQLEKTLLNSEAGTGTGLSLSSSISKSINSMPGPSTQKSSSSEDLSSSKTAKREEYVAPSENEKPRTAEVDLHSPFSVVLANKVQESTSVPRQELNQSINTEDVESTFHTVQSFLKSNSTSSTQSLEKLIVEYSMKLPLEALAHNPIYEKEMCGAIAALNENPSSLFIDEQTKQLVKLKHEFPVMVKKWRDLARAESRCQEFLTKFKEDKKKLNNWLRLEETWKSEYAKREEQARELEALLQTIRTRQKEIMEERHESSQEAQKLMLSVQEKAGKAESTSTELEMLSSEYNKKEEQARELEAILQAIKTRQKEIMDEQLVASQEAQKLMLLTQEKVREMERTSTELVTTKMQMDGLRKNWSNFQSTFP